MTQHKCGTCRYFEEGGFAGSGRCGHPLRKNIQQMVLVRKSELACRTDWADDLWEAKQEAEPVSISASARFKPESRDGKLNRQYTDRVTSVSVAMPPHPAPESTKQVEQLAAESQPTEVHDESPSEVTGSERGQFVYDPRHHLAASARRDPAPTETEPKPAAMPHEGSSVGVVKSAGDEQSTPMPTRVDTRTESRDAQRSRVFPESPPTIERRSSVANRPSTVQPSDTVQVRPPRQEQLRAVEDRVTQPRPQRPEQRQPATRQRTPDAAVPARQSEAPTFGAKPEPRSADGAVAQGRSGWTEPFSVAQPRGTQATSEATSEPQERVPVAERSPEPPRSPGAVHPTSMRECCGTCRDFRPAEGADRGWCNNQYAFDHRRMVDRNELACRGSIGSWWIASDDWWLQRADIAHHGRPTPIVDDLLRQLLDNRGAGSARRAGRS